MSATTEKLKQYDSVPVAELLIAIGHDNRLHLNVTQVQKILFILYGYYLAKCNHRLLTETPKAWPFGPVFPRARKHVNYTQAKKIENINGVSEDLQLKEIATKIVISAGKLSAQKLSTWSHLEGSPWHRTYKQKDFNWNQEIPDAYIKEYFESFFKEWQ
jgi:uncharacterized phage-associated protein